MFHAPPQGSVLAEVRRLGLVRSEACCADGSGTVVSALLPRDSQLAAHLESFAVSGHKFNTAMRQQLTHH